MRFFCGRNDARWLCSLSAILLHLELMCEENALTVSPSKWGVEFYPTNQPTKPKKGEWGKVIAKAT